MLASSSQCWLCQCTLRVSQQGICSYCLRQLPELPNCCPRCGLPSSHPELLCGRCLHKPPPWQSLVAVSHYQPPLSVLVQRFKYRKQSELSTALARLMLLSWLDARRRQRVCRPHTLLVVPLARRRQWYRGFNQSERLAVKLAHWVGCSVDVGALSRIRATPPQSTLSGVERRTNLRGVFRCHRDLQNLDIAIIDDVVTTGTTVYEISKTLLASGARSVQIWCLCRTLPTQMR